MQYIGFRASNTFSGGCLKLLIVLRSLLFIFSTFFFAAIKAGYALDKSAYTLVFFSAIYIFLAYKITFNLELSSCFYLALVFSVTIKVIF
jgi:hypothetical protein